MTDATITRESFYALYWDHAREMCRTTMARLAKFTREYAIGLSAAAWDEVAEEDRVLLRKAILDMLDVHEHNRRTLKKNPTVQPAAAMRLEPGDAPGPAEKISEHSTP